MDHSATLLPVGSTRPREVGVDLELLRVEGDRLNDPAGRLEHRRYLRHRDRVLEDPRQSRELLREIDLREQRVSDLGGRGSSRRS